MDAAGVNPVSGDEFYKRVSDWDASETSAGSGRNITRTFTGYKRATK